MNRMISLLALIFLTLVLSGCTGGLDGCIDADDFGNIKSFEIEARKEKDSSDFQDDSGVSSQYDNGNQVIKWQSTGLYTDGNPLVLRVEGGWCPRQPCKDPLMPSGSITPDPSICYDLNNFPRKDVTNAVEHTMSCPYLDCSLPENKGVSGWFSSGDGAYILFRRDGDASPNKSLMVMRNPASPQLHLGPFISEDTYHSETQSPLDPWGNPVTIEANWEIYLKIYDIHYNDNSGKYKVKLVSGFIIPGTMQVFEWVRSEVEEILTSAARAQYEAIVNNPNNTIYQGTLFAVLSIYIAVTSLGFLMGVVRASGGELLMRILKISVAIVFLTPQSWEFFSSTLFNFFTIGVKKVIGIIGTGEYDVDAPFKFLDDILWNQMYSEVVWIAKIQAIFNAGGFVGILWILSFIGVLLYFTYCAAYAVCLYLVCMTVISFLIAIFPLAFLGIFFTPLKSTFDAWIGQCMSNAAQAIMVFATVVFFSDIIFAEMYRVLGFKSCKAVVFDVALFVFGDSDENDSEHSLLKIKGFVPGYNQLYKKISLLDMDTLGWNEQRYSFGEEKRAIIYLPPDYKIKDYRYIDLPFVDPNIDSESVEDPADWGRTPTVNTQRGYNKLEDVLHRNELVRPQDIVVMIVIALVMHQILLLSASLAQFIVAGQMSFSHTAADAVSGLYHEFMGLVQSNKVLGTIYGATLGQVDRLRNKIGSRLDVVEGWVDKAAGTMPLSSYAIDKGVIAQSKDIIAREKAYRIVHAYQDAVGGTVEWTADRAGGVGKAVTKFGLNPLPMRYVAIGMNLLGKAAAGESAKDIATHVGHSVRDAVHGQQKFGSESYAGHMQRVMGPYFDHSGRYDRPDQGFGVDGVGSSSATGDGVGGQVQGVSREGAIEGIRGTDDGDGAGRGGAGMRDLRSAPLHLGGADIDDSFGLERGAQIGGAIGPEVNLTDFYTDQGMLSGPGGRVGSLPGQASTAPGGAGFGLGSGGQAGSGSVIGVPGEIPSEAFSRTPMVERVAPPAQAGSYAAQVTAVPLTEQVPTLPSAEQAATPPSAATTLDELYAAPPVVLKPESPYALQPEEPTRISHAAVSSDTHVRDVSPPPVPAVAPGPLPTPAQIMEGPPIAPHPEPSISPTQAAAVGGVAATEGGIFNWGAAPAKTVVELTPEQETVAEPPTPETEPMREEKAQDELSEEELAVGEKEGRVQVQIRNEIATHEKELTDLLGKSTLGGDNSALDARRVELNEKINALRVQLK